jgi:hypothetical protein
MANPPDGERGSIPIIFDFFTDRGYKFSVINGEGSLALELLEVAMSNDQPFEFSFNVLIEKDS